MDITDILRDLLLKWQINDAIEWIAEIKKGDLYTEEIREIEKTIALLIQVRTNLMRGRAVATGIGAFAVIYRRYTGGCIDENERIDDGVEILLRRRLEKDSIVYGQDLSGKWELIGGGMETDDFIPGQAGYLGSIAKTVYHEAMDEAGLNLAGWNFSGMVFPAMLSKDTDEQALRDNAFSIPIEWQEIFATAVFHAKCQRNELRWIDENDLDGIEIVSPRMRFLIMQALTAVKRCHCDCGGHC